MARLVTLAKAGGKAPFADGGLKLSKSIQTSEIEPHEKFKTLFKIDEDVLQRITGSMKKSGFDASQPVHIWKHTDDAGVTHNYLIDGYTRLSACEKAGITSVPYYEDKFDTEEQAFMHVLHLQVDRRNLAPEELLKFVEELMGSEYVRSTKGRTTEIIADTLGLSPRTVQKAINVIENGDDETKERIASGEITINKADKEIQKKEEKKVGETRRTRRHGRFWRHLRLPFGGKRRESGRAELLALRRAGARRGRAVQGKARHGQRGRCARRGEPPHIP